MLRRSMFYLLMVGAPISSALYVLAPQVLATLYQSQFQQVAPTLRILGWAMVCIFASSPLVTALTALGRQAVFTRIALCAVGFNVTLNVFLIPRLGIEGAALTTLLTEAGVLATCVLVVRRHLATRLLTAGLVIKLPLVCAVASGAAWLARGWPLWWAMAMLAGVLALLLWALGCFPIDLLAGYERDRGPVSHRGTTSCPTGP
jgi:O-antigen/teichoic acid export membrane protein